MSSQQAQDSGSGSPIHWPEPLPLPDELLAVKPFDADLLPETLRPWVSDIAERLQCPPDFPAVGAMVVLAGLIGRKIGIRPQGKTDWQVVPNLWGAVIGRPGIMKSPALQEPLNILRWFEVKAKQEFESAMRDHNTREIVAKASREVLQSDLKRALKAKSGAEEIAAQMQELEHPVPVRRRYVANDSTVEKLGVLLNENPNGILVFRDELTGFLKGLDKPGQEGNRAFYLEAWNGDGRFTYDRIGRGTLDIAAAIVSIIGGIQPGPLSEYLRKLAAGGAGDDGLLQRFQLGVWPDNSKSWQNVDTFPDSQAKELALATYERLDQLQPVELATERDEYEPVPFIRFDHNAQEIFDAWRAELEPRLRSGDEHPAIESHLAKYRSLVPTLALLIHLADEPDGGPVTAASLRRSLSWATYLESHARRIYGAISQSSTVSAKALASKILNRTLPDGFTLRDVYRPAWSGLTDRSDADAAVNVLIDHDWLTIETLDTGGKPKTVYQINPIVFTRNLLKAN